MLSQLKSKPCDGRPGHLCVHDRPVLADNVYFYKGRWFKSGQAICEDCTIYWIADIAQETGQPVEIWSGNSFIDVLYEENGRWIGQWTGPWLRRIASANAICFG